MAEAWSKKREREIDDAIANGRPVTTRTVSNSTLGEAIDRYIKESRTAIGKTKAQVLATIRKEYDIAGLRCDKITSQDLVAFAKELHNRPSLESAATVLNHHRRHPDRCRDIGDHPGMVLGALHLVPAFGLLHRIPARLLCPRRAKVPAGAFGIPPMPRSRRRLPRLCQMVRK